MKYRKVREIKRGGIKLMLWFELMNDKVILNENDQIF